MLLNFYTSGYTRPTEIILLSPAGRRKKQLFFRGSAPVAAPRRRRLLTRPGRLVKSDLANEPRKVEAVS